MAIRGAAAILGVLLALQCCAASTCQTDEDCNLNGRCTAGTCACAPAWQGPRCERMALLPARRSSDFAEEGVSTWGGSIVYRNASWHMYVSEMLGSCGITSWQSNSQVSGLAVYLQTFRFSLTTWVKNARWCGRCRSRRWGHGSARR